MPIFNLTKLELKEWKTTEKEAEGQRREGRSGCNLNSVVEWEAGLERPPVAAWSYNRRSRIGFHYNMKKKKENEFKLILCGLIFFFP